MAQKMNTKKTFNLLKEHHTKFSSRYFFLLLFSLRSSCLPENDFVILKEMRRQFFIKART